MLRYQTLPFNEYVSLQTMENKPFEDLKSYWKSLFLGQGFQESGPSFYACLLWCEKLFVVNQMYSERCYLWLFGKFRRTIGNKTWGLRILEKSCYLPCYLSKYRLQALEKYFSKGESAPFRMNLFTHLWFFWTAEKASRYIADIES